MKLPDEITDTDLLNRFNFHPVKEGQAEKYEAIRRHCGLLAQFIRNTTPGCREQAVAIAKLEEAMFLANAAIARND